MKAFLVLMAIVFAIATIALYNSSVNELDSYTARQLGIESTINTQATVFCAACAIMCIINIVVPVISAKQIIYLTDSLWTELIFITLILLLLS